MNQLFFTRLGNAAFGALLALTTFALASFWFRTPAWSTFAVPVYLAALGLSAAGLFGYARLRVGALQAPSQLLRRRYASAALALSCVHLLSLALAASTLYMVPASTALVALAAKGLGLFSCGVALAAMWLAIGLRKPATFGMPMHRSSPVPAPEA